MPEMVICSDDGFKISLTVLGVGDGQLAFLRIMLIAFVPLDILDRMTRILPDGIVASSTRLQTNSGMNAAFAS